LRVIPIDDIPLGSPLGQALFNDRGDVLAQVGVRLDPALVASIKARGYSQVVVNDRQSEGIHVMDPLSPETRQRATKATRNTVVMGERVSNLLGVDQAAPPDRLPRSGDVHKLISGGVPAEDVLESVRSLVDEVIDAPTTLGLNTIKGKDSFAFTHGVEVATVAVKLGREVGLEMADLRRLGRGAMLHDIGQAFTGDTSDGKTSAMSAADVEQVKRHTRLGYDFLGHVPGFEPLANQIAFQHHEWHNGGGYPRGLIGASWGDKVDGSKNIMLIAQITSVADVYDALCSDRPFRQPLPRELAMSLMKRMAGQQLNGDLIQLFTHVVPVFPPGYPIRVVGGALDKWQGVVATLGSPDINRPTVRLWIRPDGEEVEPFELDLARDSSVRLMTAPPKRRSVAPVR
jgi:HD-GYP domain-containing protein (c-di-GMP phosphodiesterase class II)